MNKYDVIAIILILLGGVVLGLLARVFKKYPSTKWRILYFIPLLLTWILAAIAGPTKDMVPVYLGAFVLMAGFFTSREKVRTLAGLSAGLLSLLGLLFCKVDTAYRAVDFTRDFKNAFEVMKERYCLTEYKDIDWDALYREYLQRFQEAGKSHDKVENALIWMDFAQEFHDGHVAFYPAEEKVSEEAKNLRYGNDYGFSMMTLENGQSVAVNVEVGSEAYRAGIREGSRILTFDGVTVEEKKKEAEHFLINYPDKENEDFYRAVYAAGLGGEEIIVSFEDGEGKEKSVTLAQRGPYVNRLEKSLEILDQGANMGSLTFSEVDEDTILFRVKMMMYDSDSYGTENNSDLSGEVREQLLKYREEGKQKLIIDLRGNSGGSPYVAMEIIKLLATPGEHFGSAYGIVDEKTGNWQYDESTGKYKVGGHVSFQGENLWEEGEIIVLVNASCVSAGDHFAVMAHESCDNITIMGFTKSNGSGQAIRGVNMECGSLSFSSVPTMNEQGDIFVDAGADRVAGVPLDVRIPFDENAVKALYIDGEDYALNYALQYKK